MKLIPMIVGNWKLNKTPTAGSSFVEKTTNLLLEMKNVSVIFAPPFTGLFDLNVEPPFYSAAQNCHWEENGAFTGEISVSMIQDCGTSFVILGHSERRHIFGETNEWINRKVKAVLAGNLKPILCVGESLEQRDAGQTELVLKSQLEEGLNGVNSLQNVVIAYEPVWAIGTGVTASLEQVESAHHSVRKILDDLYPDFDDIHVLYGGSVNSGNAESLIQVSGVNGFLIGGASLDVTTFTSIINNVENFQMRTL
ncbi:triose-phosphate isomerase [Candidatus Marinimicrobia bacterium]|nr:triose-phosphate isomerase [Candidatus Neomarinimicrobiota bacterium]